MKIGDIVSAKVTNILGYGAFVVVGEHDGLVHISEFSDNYVKNINDFVKIGQELRFKVLEVDEEDKNIISDNAEVTVSEFLDEMIVTGLNVKLVVTSKDGIEKKGTDFVGTGDLFTSYVNDVMKDQYTLIVIGDTSGDGKVTSLDLIHLRKHIVLSE